MQFDITRLFEIAKKGLDFIQSAAQQGSDVSVAIRALTNIFSKKLDQVTSEDLDQTEKMLDEQIAKFNEELPEEK